MPNNTNRTQKPRKKITYTPAPLPAEGFVRLLSVLAVLGISRTSFHDGIKAGKYPAGILLSPRCRVWPVSEIRDLIDQVTKGDKTKGGDMIRRAPALAANQSVGGRPQKNNTSILPKFPAYGKALAERWLYNNLPSLIVICIGANCWQRARRWNSHTHFAALVLTPGQQPAALKWQVGGCLVLLEWGTGPSESRIVDLIKVLLSAGAVSVTVSPLFVDFNKPAVSYDYDKSVGQRWVRVRESIHTYKPRKEQENVA